MAVVKTVSYLDFFLTPTFSKVGRHCWKGTWGTEMRTVNSFCFRFPLCLSAKLWNR